MNEDNIEFLSKLQKLIPFDNPEDIPLSFKIGDKFFKGLNENMFPIAFTEDSDCKTEYKITAFYDSLKITVAYKEYKDFPCVEWMAEILNSGNENSEIISDMKILSDAVLPGECPVIEYSNGETYTEDGYSIFREALTDKPFRLSPDEGTPCAFASPFIRLIFPDHCVSMAIGWPGKWEFTAKSDKSGASVSLGQEKLYSYLKPGEKFRTPRIMMLYTDGDVTNAYNTWRRFYFRHICPKTHGNEIKPLTALWKCDSIYDWHIHDTEQDFINDINDYLNNGIKPDVYWIDAGWYKYSGEWITVGTWDCDKDRLPNGLRPIGDYCKKNGIQFLLWFEPERAYPGTEIGDKYPQYLLSVKEPVGFFPGSLLFDFSNPEACAFITDLIDKRIKEYNVTIYRQDFNMPPLNYWRENDAEDRQGSHENLHIQGYLKFWDDLKARNPGLLIDSCASGGKRNDLEAMMRALPMHYSDIGYGKHTVSQKQHNFLYMWTPYFREINWSWISKNGEYGKFEDAQYPDNYSYHSNMAPMITDYIEKTPDGYARARDFLPIWRKAAELMISGDFYPLSECRNSSEDYYAIQFDDTEKHTGFVQLVSNIKCNIEKVTLNIHTEENRKYIFRNPQTSEEFTKTSKELINGLVLTTHTRSGQIWFYEVIL